MASGLLRDLSIYVVVCVLLGALQEQHPWLTPSWLAGTAAL